MNLNKKELDSILPILNVATKYKHIILDFDGVLTNLNVDWNLLKKELLNLLEINKGKNNNLNWLKLCAKLKNKENIFHVCISNAEKKGLIVQDVSPILDMLVKENKLLYILSNSTRSTIEIFLNKNNFMNSIKSIVSQDELIFLKPYISNIREKLGIKNTNKVLFIGDSIVDEMTAKINSIDFYYYKYTKKNK